MSETTPSQKIPTTHHAPKPKVEPESHLLPSATPHVESATLVQDELLESTASNVLRPTGSDVLRPSGGDVLSHGSSTLLRQPAASQNTANAKPLTAAGFAGRNFAGLPNHGTIQTKLTVGAAHDPYEEEADQVAEQVMRMPASTFAAPASPSDPNEGAALSLQRSLAEEEELQTKPLASSITPVVQRASTIDEETVKQVLAEDAAQPDALVQRTAEEEEALQTKRVAASDSFETNANFEGRVAATRGSGSPLPDTVRSFMEPRFGADFSNVRLHADHEAANLNQQVSAQAFTLGSDIYLGEGKTDVTSESGKQLLAHELTHVVQQGGAVARKPLVQRAVDPETETEAAPLSLEAAVAEAQTQVTEADVAQEAVALDAKPIELPGDNKLAGGDAPAAGGGGAAAAAPAQSQPASAEEAPANSASNTSQTQAAGASAEAVIPPSVAAVATSDTALESDAQTLTGEAVSTSTTPAGSSPIPAATDSMTTQSTVEKTEAQGSDQPSPATTTDAAPATTPATEVATSGATGAAPASEVDATAASTSSATATSPTATSDTSATTNEASADKPALGAITAQPVTESAASASPTATTDTSTAKPASQEQATPASKTSASVADAPVSAATPSATAGSTPANAPALGQDAIAKPAQTTATAIKSTEKVASVSPSSATPVAKPAASVEPIEKTAPTAAPTTAKPSTVAKPADETTDSTQPSAQSTATATPSLTTPAAATPPLQPDEDEKKPVRRTLLRRMIQRALAIAPRSAEEDPAFQQVVAKSKAAAQQEKVHEPAATAAAESQAAADPKGKDVEMAAQNKQVAEMQAQPSGEFNAEVFKAELKKKIAEKSPKNLEEAEKFKNNNSVGQIKNEVSGKVKAAQENAAGPIENKTEEQPDKSGIPGKEVKNLEKTDAGPQPADIGAQAAAPKPRTEAEVSTPLQEQSQSLDQQMAQGGVTPEQLEKSNEPQFTGALKQKQDAQQNAVQAPQQFRQQEQTTLTAAQNEAVATADQQKQDTRSEREKLLQSVFGLKGETKTADEVKRREVYNKIAGYYETTKTEVETILNGLDKKVESDFENGANQAKQAFENYVGARMDKWKEERYGAWYDIGKWGNRFNDWAFGLPPEVDVFYQEGRNEYTRTMDGVIDSIASHIVAELNRAKQRIVQGKQQIQDYVLTLSPELQQIGQQAAQNIQGKFNELGESVDNKQGELVDSLAEKYHEKLQEVDARIEEMKLENSGLVNKAAQAIDGVIKTIKELGQLLMSALQRAAGAVTLILQDPIKFLGNLIKGVAQGLKNFGSNILQHLQTGLMSWLTGALGGIITAFPKSFTDLPGILSMVLEILGLTYTQIRGKVVQGIGEKGEQVVGALEKAWEIFQIIRTKGLGGLWEFIKDMIGDLKAMVIEQIQSIIANEVIQAGIQWIIGLLGGPAGAFVKAVQAIIKIVTWFVNNASRLVSFVNSVLDSIVAIASGDIGGAAKYIENTLAKALPLVIGFLADLLGLGGIAKKVQGVIAKIRAPIDKAIAWIVKKAVAMAKKILAKLRGKSTGEPDQTGQTHDGAQAEIGKTITFSANQESHKLWVEVKGTQATLMMASTPMSVQERLSSWEARLADLSEEKRPGVKNLIAQARAQLAKADQQGDTLAQEQATKKEETAAELERKDDALESSEESLAKTLSSILNIFVDEGADVIADWIGKKVVNRSDTGDDTLIDPSRTPTGYVYNNLQRLKRTGVRGAYLIIKRGAGNKGNAQYPAVAINAKGVLAYGEAEPYSASDEEKIAEYQKILQAAQIPPASWPEIEEVEAYRRKMRQLVVSKYAGNLQGLDKEIISARIVSATYNKVIGEIFEEWCAANKALVRRPAPEFILVSNDGQLQKCVADARIEGTKTLVEMKAISAKAGPTAEQREQMKAYYQIISKAIPWIRGPQPADRITFAIVRYIFNNQAVANEWKPALDEHLPNVYESDPPYDPNYEHKIDEAVESYKKATQGQAGGANGSGTPTIQRKAVDTASPDLREPQNLEARVAHLRQGGQPLPDSERAFFERRMGIDFSGVRLHADTTAQETAQNLSARAFTIGQHVVLRPDEYQPGTPAGRKLLAHELAHVVQQGGAGPRQAAGAGAIVQRETDLDLLATSEALKRYQYTSPDGQTLKKVKDIIDAKFGPDSRDENYNNALKVEFEKAVAALVFDNLTLVAGTVRKVSNNVLKYLTVHVLKEKDTIRLSIDKLEQVYQELQGTLNQQQVKQFQDQLMGLMAKTKGMLGYIEAFAHEESFAKFKNMLQSGPSSANELAAHLNLHLSFYTDFFAQDYKKVRATIQEGQEKVGAATEELRALTQQISTVAREYEQDQERLSNPAYNPARTLQPDKQFLEGKPLDEVPLEKLEQMLTAEERAELEQAGYPSLNDADKRKELKKYIGRPRGPRLTDRMGEDWRAPVMSGPTRMPADPQGKPQPNQLEPLGGSDSPYQQGVNPFMRGSDMFHLNEASAWAQKARLELDMPLMAGPSGSTALMMTAALELGLSGGNEKLEYALAVVGSLVGGAHHSFHEVMSIAQLVGVPYVEGDYASVLNAVPGALRGPLQALMNEPKYAPIFHKGKSDGS